MSKLSGLRLSRIAAAGLAVLSAFAAAPIAAQADTTPLQGELIGGAMSNTAPEILPFSVLLSGTNQTKYTMVGPWNVIDATGTGAGYNVTVAQTPPTVNGSTTGAGTGGSLTLTPPTMSAAPGNPAPIGPVAQPPQTLSITTASTIESAAPGTGQGEWDYAGDSGDSDPGLAVVIPGDAGSGSYNSTLTYTTAPLVTG